MSDPQPVRPLDRIRHVRAVLRAQATLHHHLHLYYRDQGSQRDALNHLAQKHAYHDAADSLQRALIAWKHQEANDD